MCGPLLTMPIADAMAADVTGQIDYIQEEFLARNIPLTAALSEKKARCLAAEAADLVLDLLVQGGDA